MDRTEPAPHLSKPMNIVFDFGNVLLDWNPAQLASTHFANELPAHHTPHSFAAAMVSDDWIAYDNGDYDLSELARALAPKLGCDEEKFAAFVGNIPHVLPPLESSIAAMSALFDARDRGAKLRVFYLSNMPGEFADILERRFEWTRRFDGGIFSARARLSKPNAAIFAALEDVYQLVPESTLFLDDSVANVAAAASRCWRTVHVKGQTDVSDGLRAHGILNFV